MKDADAWFAEGMKDVELSWHADYHSEVKGNLENAIADFDQALHGPLAPAVVHDALRDLEPARSAYYALLREKGNDANVWMCAGDAFLRAGRSQNAIEACENLLRLTPEDAVGWWNLAEALAQAGRREEAVAAYRESLRIRPGHLAASARLKVVLDAMATTNADPDRKRR